MSRTEHPATVSGADFRPEPVVIDGAQLRADDRIADSIRPIGDQALCEVLPPEQLLTAGGLEVPAVARLPKARVLRVGPGRLSPEGRRIAPTVKPGDVVLFANPRTRAEVIGLEFIEVPGRSRPTFITSEQNFVAICKEPHTS